MSMREAVMSCFQKYVQFSGRACRAEFWKFVLFLLLVHIVLIIANSAIFGPELVTDLVTVFDDEGGKTNVVKQKLIYNGGILANILIVLTIVPYLAVLWRRMHDFGHTGWLALVPFIIVFLTVLLAVVSTVGWAAMVDALLDTGRVQVSGNGSPILWLGFVLALISAITILVLLSKRSVPIENRFGPVPNGVEQA